ncbi:type II toxin-antitoxin system PemK/MazF family toxin [Thermincola ferriacetica]
MNIDLTKTQMYLDWLKQKLYLDWKSRNTNASKRKVKRGQVYYCEFGKGIGSEQENERPCLILQNDVGNINSPNTIVAPITNEQAEPKVSVKIIGNYPYIDQRDQQNKYLTGFVLLANIQTISKARLGQFITTLTSEMDEIDDKILVSLGMIKKFKKLKETIAKDKEYIKKINSENQIMKNILKELKEITGATTDKQILEKIAASIDNSQ